MRSWRGGNRDRPHAFGELEAGVQEILIDEATLQGRIAELGAEITRDATKAASRCSSAS